MKKISVICLFLLSLFLSSCFEVVEDMKVDRDGSGSMTLTVNLSQSRTKLAAIMMMDTINGHKVPERQDIQQEIDKLVTRLNSTPGISNAKGNIDFTSFIAVISFSFRDVANVNRAISNIMDQYKVKGMSAANYSYNEAEGRFSRVYKNTGDVREQYNKLRDRDKEIFSSAMYISIFRFENTITDYSNKLSRVARNQLAIMQRCSVKDLINGKTDISNQIQLSK
ncbi:hypothetical protein [Chitinophaga tropicalis]|uniref:Lipoprotein n=1 Tax=Chitinophaga tropicalis TaxID=2683588 RepID=A0A7K1U7K1_9BACT|nr:hypothetical protein [Chitinophaga tropicalis]MVT10276.1 hypothetical protein [Chitinophaga tropicalis]